MNFEKVTQLIGLIENETGNRANTRERVGAVLRELRGEMFERTFTMAEIYDLGGPFVEIFGGSFPEGTLAITNEMLGLTENEAPLYDLAKSHFIIDPNGDPFNAGGERVEIHFPYTEVNSYGGAFNYDDKLRIKRELFYRPEKMGYTFELPHDGLPLTAITKQPLLIFFDGDIINDPSGSFTGGDGNTTLTIKLFYYKLPYPNF